MDIFNCSKRDVIGTQINSVFSSRIKWQNWLLFKLTIEKMITKGKRLFTVLDYKYSSWCWAEGCMFLKR